MARSGRPEALIPATPPAATNPAGIAARRSTGGRSVGSAERGWVVVTVAIAVQPRPLRCDGELLETEGLGQAVDEVERLDRLTGGALHEVVDDADREDSI